MRLFSSFKQFIRVFKNDLSLRRCGIPFGWYLKQFYRGRWYQRKGLPTPTLNGAISLHSQSIQYSIKLEHLGAFHSIFGEEEYELSKVMAAAPATILDLGANVGMASSYFHARYSDALIACVEPDPRNLPTLQQTLEANGIQPVIFPVAVASKAGTLNLMMAQDSTMSALETSVIRHSTDTVQVEVQTIAEIIAKLGWTSVDLLKIDIEGTEDELLSQNNEWLKRVKAIVMEIHPNTTPERIQSYLSPFGFKLESLKRATEPVFFAQRTE